MTPLRRFLIVTLLAGALAWLLVARMGGDRNTGRAHLASPPDAAGSTSAPPPHPASSTPPAARAETPTLDSAPQRPPSLALATGLLPWEKQIAEAAARGRDAAGQARELLALLPHLPEEALATATEQAIEHLPDADYATTVVPLLTAPKTHGQVASVLFADLMERPDPIALPALLRIAQTPDHPYSSAALDSLRLLLRAEFGRDWRAWESAVQRATGPTDR